MSIIVPAGNKNVSWSPKEETLVKTASTGTPEVKEETNALYEAAKSYIEAAADCCKVCKKPNSLCSCAKSDSASSDAKSDKKSDVKMAASKASSDAKSDAKSDAASSDAKSDKKSDVKTAQYSDLMTKVDGAKSDSKSGSSSTDGASSDSKSGSSSTGSNVFEVAGPASEVKEEGEKTGIEGAVEKIEEAVEEIKEEANISEVAEVEIEVEDAPCAEVKIPEIPGKDVSQSEIIVESNPTDPCACASKKVEMAKAASTEEEFCRFAKLTPANRTKLADYWVNMLGFPKDYVNLMVKDYEK